MMWPPPKPVQFMTHEQLIAECATWFWNDMISERRMLYAVNNNVSSMLSPYDQRKQGAKNKAMGVVAGVFDFCLIGDRRVCWLDGKVGYDKPSDEQLDFMTKCQIRGHMCLFFGTLDEFQEIVYNFLS